MMKKHSKKTKVVVAVSLLAGIFSVTGVTMAGYSVAALADQTVMPNGGIMKKSIFLDCMNIWNVLGKEYYYAKVSDGGSSSKWILPSKTIDVSVTVSGVASQKTLQVFELDTTSYDHITFARVNPRCFKETNTLSEDASEWRVVGGTNAMGNWNHDASTVELYQNVYDSNHYAANHVSLSAGNKLKIHKKAGDTADGTWLSNNSALAYFHLSGGNQSDIVMDVTGIFTIDFYVSATGENHVVMTKEYQSDADIPLNTWNQTPEITVASNENYYTIDNWSGGDGGNCGYTAYSFDGTTRT